MVSTRLLTKSVASAGKRDTSPSARRTIISGLDPLRLSGSFKPSRIAATRMFTVVDSPGWSTPTLRLFVVCCARAASGQAAAAPPRSVINSRSLVCRERSIVRGDEGRIMTRPSSRPEARSRLGCQTANELGAPVASSMPEQLPGHEPASARMGYEDGHALFLRYRRVEGPLGRGGAAWGVVLFGE